MAYGYLGRLEESFDKMLLEAQQVVIDFKAIYGADTYEAFKRIKQRLGSPENDISYWVRKYRNEGDSAKEALRAAMGEIENVKRDIEGAVIPEPADTKDLLAENEFYSVYRVDDWTDMVDLAMRKIDGFAGAYWCIAGRYKLREAAANAGIAVDDAVKLSQAEHFFEQYLGDEYRAYVVCMPKDPSHQKYCLCLDQSADYYILWDTRDSRTADDDAEDIPHFTVDGAAFTGVESLEGHADLDNEEDEPEDEGPHEWQDENGNTHVGEEPDAPRDPEMIHVDNPNALEFHVGTKEEAIAAFKDSGAVNDVEFVEDIPGTPICIVKFMVEPTHEEFPQEGDDVYVRDLPGDRYTAFIFMPGDGGGPLLTPQGDIIASRTVEGAKAPFAREFHQDQVYHQGEEPRRPEEREGDEEIAEESYQKEIKDADNVEANVSHFNSAGPNGALRESGYDGYSMSNNAREAYANDEKPLSRWSKEDIIGCAAAIDAKKAELLRKVPLEKLRQQLLTWTSWHHTSSHYNKTDFYSFDEDAFENVQEDDIDRWVESHRQDVADKKKEKDVRKARKGRIDYLVWYGSRAHPRASEEHLDNVNIEERGSFYLVTDDSGREILRKKIGSNGTRVRFYESVGMKTSVKEGYWSYDYPVNESCALNEDARGEFTIVVGDEEIEDVDGGVMVFDTELKANEYALNDLELLQGDYRVIKK